MERFSVTQIQPQAAQLHAGVVTGHFGQLGRPVEDVEEVQMEEVHFSQTVPLMAVAFARDSSEPVWVILPRLVFVWLYHGCVHAPPNEVIEADFLPGTMVDVDEGAVLQGAMGQAWALLRRTVVPPEGVVAHARQNL